MFWEEVPFGCNTGEHLSVKGAQRMYISPRRTTAVSSNDRREPSPVLERNLSYQKSEYHPEIAVLHN